MTNLCQVLFSPLSFFASGIAYRAGGEEAAV
jgi:hypothetical protein